MPTMASVIVAALTLVAAAAAWGGLGWLIVAVVLCRWQDELERDLPWIQLGAGALVAGCGALFVLPTTSISWGTPFKLLILMFLSSLVTPFVFALADWLKQEARE